MHKKTVGKLGLHKGGLFYASINGKRVYAPRDICTNEAATLWHAKLLIEHANNDDVEKTKVATVATLFSMYLSSVEKETTVENVRDKKRILDSFSQQFGDFPPSNILPLMVESFLAKRPIRTNGGGQYNVYAHLLAAFRWIDLKMRTRDNPMIGVKRPARNARGEEYVIEPHEWHAIKPSIPGREYRDLAEVLWQTGARPGEIIDATIEEWHSDSSTLTKRLHKTKSKGKTRVIKCNDHARKIILEAIGTRTEGRIFVGPNGNGINGTWLCETIQNAAEKQGRIKPIIAYSLRHSFAVRNLEAGHTIHQVAAWLGNTVAICEEHYAHTIQRLRHKHNTLVPC